MKLKAIINVKKSQQRIQKFRLRTIQVDSKDPLGHLPKLGTLERFGKVQHCWTLCIRNGVRAGGPANTAIVVFTSPDSVKRAFESFHNDESFWKTDSIAARPLTETGDINSAFITNVISLHVRAKAMLNGKPFDHDSSQPISMHKKRSSLETSEPMAKRPRTQGSNQAIVVGGQTEFEPQTSPAPQTPEWMRGRIAQLEAELDSAKAARDMATSEQEVIATANQAERAARREAMAQKSAAESSLSRKEVEQDRLRAELEFVTSQQSALLRDVEILRGQLATAENRLNLAQSSSDEFAKSSDRIKALETELGEVQDRAHKLQLYKSRMEEQNTNSDNTGVDDMRGKIKILKSEIKQMKSDLASAHEQLESTQRALDSRMRKCSSTRAKYESTKAKLGVYKARLENERIIMEKLKETLTPAAYKSLGVIHETLGAFLSTMDLSPVGDEGCAGPKEEVE
ncbi:unnamed protein product [Rhizoctonia solani]|uniref:RRM domain-containing protein n=1 Tax=Rhizoctonia solani TaxID=456999 RepID=A0A8H3HVG2_9AGAM|nr:unnamed protein product [Rhizoctonia solani]